MSTDASHLLDFLYTNYFVFLVFILFFLILWLVRQVYSREKQIRLLQQTQLDQAERVRSLADQADFGMFLLGFFHDLATPLSVLNLYLDELNARQWIMPHQREHQALVDGAVRSNMIINEYVVQARERFRLPSAATVFEIRDLLTDVVAQHAGRAQRIQVVIRTKVFSEIASVRGVKFRLFQVLNNVVSNALDAYEKSSGEGNREISLVVSDRGEELLIEVTDWAGGICPIDQAKIFEPFFSTKDSSHFGIGLALCRQIIEQEWSGSLVCLSDQEAGWTRFQIQVPLRRN